MGSRRGSLTTAPSKTSSATRRAGDRPPGAGPPMDIIRGRPSGDPFPGGLARYTTDDDMKDAPVRKAVRSARRRIPLDALPQPTATGDDDAWRRHNVGRLLNNAISRFERRILELMDAAGYGGFSLSHITITRNLDTQGTRATELARRAGITKQSMGDLIAQLEASGIVARRPDPTDGRSRIVFFTPAGTEWLRTFHDALLQAETEMQDILGPRRMRALKRALVDYDQAPHPRNGGA